MEPINIKFIQYINSECITMQGQKGKIYKKYGKDYNIKYQGAGNGNFLITRPSDAIAFTDKPLESFSLRRPILQHLDKSKLTSQMVQKIENDIKNNKLAIYNENNNYVIKKL